MKLKNLLQSKKVIIIISSSLLIFVALVCFLLCANNNSINNLAGTTVQENANINAPKIKEKLSDYTWEEIVAISNDIATCAEQGNQWDSKYFTPMFNILTKGEDQNVKEEYCTKTFKFTCNEQEYNCQAVLVAVGPHYTDEALTTHDGTGLTFQIQGVLGQVSLVEDASWKNQPLYAKTLPDFYNAMSDITDSLNSSTYDLKSAIRVLPKETQAEYNGSIETTEEGLWLPSATEYNSNKKHRVEGTEYFSYANEWIDSRYSGIQRNRSRNACCWTRTAQDCDSSVLGTYINKSNGHIEGNNNSHEDYSIFPCFSIGSSGDSKDYDITYNTNGGTWRQGFSVPTSYISNKTDPILPSMSGITKTDEQGRELKFAGWYENPDFSGKQVGKICLSDRGNKEYWAKWTTWTNDEKLSDFSWEDLKFIANDIEEHTASGDQWASPYFIPMYNILKHGEKALERNKYCTKKVNLAGNTTCYVCNVVLVGVGPHYTNDTQTENDGTGLTFQIHGGLPDANMADAKHRIWTQSKLFKETLPVYFNAMSTVTDSTGGSVVTYNLKDAIKTLVKPTMTDENKKTVTNVNMNLWIPSATEYNGHSNTPKEGCEYISYGNKDKKEKYSGISRNRQGGVHFWTRTATWEKELGLYQKYWRCIDIRGNVSGDLNDTYNCGVRPCFAL